MQAAQLFCKHLICLTFALYDHSQNMHGNASHAKMFHRISTPNLSSNINPAFAWICLALQSDRG